MSVREWVVLGTASQVPTRYRNHNGYLLLWDGEGILFDPGEGTQRQLLLAGVSASSITKVMITHFHGDHCLGFAGICQRLSLDGVAHPVDVYFPASGEVFYERLCQASIYHARARLRPHPIESPGVLFEDGAFRLECQQLDHPCDTFGYRLREPDRRSMQPDKLERAGISGPLVGELQEKGAVEIGGRVVQLEDVSAQRPGQSVAFVMDTRRCDGALELARGVDVLVCESTYLSSEEADATANGHMTATHAATLALDAGAKQLVLTHFSQRYEAIEPFVDEAQQIFPNVVAVRDGDRVPIRRPKKAGGVQD